jgi:two-component system response regulator DegU
MNIYLADDHVEFRNAVALYLSKELLHTIVGEASDGVEFLNDPRAHDADIVLMDINMPNLNGIDATKKWLWHNSTYKIIAVTMNCEALGLVEIVGAGFKGFICKQHFYDNIILALETVHKGKLYFPDRMKLN